jgi:undecaprenyl diphosphate synthase
MGMQGMEEIWKRWKKMVTKTPEPALAVSQRERIPHHVAIIMDGNGRWAKERGLPRVAGHRAGMKAVKEVTRAANELGVKILTLYAFSTENWKRPKHEVDYLMKLPQEFLDVELEELMEQNVRVTMIGKLEALPPSTRRAVATAIEKTKQNTGMNLNFALNYGSRDEIVEAAREVARLAAEGKIHPDDINEQMFGRLLLTGGMSDPDLLIRTSGELRLSNFLLWQLAYTELWFTETFWPDFTREHFIAAVRAYQKRGRRFGGL